MGPSRKHSRNRSRQRQRPPATPPRTDTSKDSDAPSRPMLNLSTGFTVGTRSCSWFLSMAVVFLSPVLLPVAAIRHFPNVFRLLKNLSESPRGADLTITIMVMYTYLIILAAFYAHILSPRFLCLNQLTLFPRFRHRRDHISHMRLDRQRNLVATGGFTIFIEGTDADRRSVPMFVAPTTRLDDIWDALRARKLIPSTGAKLTHRLTVFGRLSNTGKATLSELGLGPLSHLRLSVILPGGAPSAPPDSPAKNTRSHASGSAMPSSPIVLVSPKKKRRKIQVQEDTTSDHAVWDQTDSEIIAGARKSWKSEVYNHYDVTLERLYNPDKTPLKLRFKFSCKFDKNHAPVYRDRMSTSHGTQNLQRTSKTCNSKRGVAGDGSPAGGQQDLHGSISRYTAVRHRAIIAMRCAVSHRPFNMVQDPLYRQEVELLRPGTILPAPSTLANDLQIIYQHGAQRVKEYFMGHVGAIHLVVDGWTAPFVVSYLGIVVIWFSAGKIWRATLEFIRLIERHTGDYLAKFHTICMDNASNCDATATELPKYIPTFRGALSRSRCFPHTVNLVAKAFISFFFKAPKKKSKVKVAPTKRKRAQASGPSTRAASTTFSAAVDEVLPAAELAAMDDIEDFMTPEEEEEEALLQELAEDQDGEELDDGKAEYDARTVNSVRQEAINVGREMGIHISSSEEATALAIFPKIAGLARRLHDVSIYQDKFEKIVDLNPGMYAGQKRTLTRRVATRWNSDLDCLESHILFESVVRQLTSDPQNSLGKYALTEEQWSLAKELLDPLRIFRPVTELFSRKEVPLVHEVIPMIEELEHSLSRVRDDTALRKIVRIAAIASLLVVSKYYALTDDNEVYRISVVMCPNKKISWFRNNEDWREEDTNTVDKLVRDRFNESYAGAESSTRRPDPTTSSTSAAEASKRSKYSVRRFDEDDDGSTSTARYPLDSIEGYLHAPNVPKSEIEQAGGYLKYWEAARVNRPRIAQFALDYLSAPASSVDAERAFSGGRLQVGHLQHGMNSQTFKARVALASWYNTPLLPEDAPALILSEAKAAKTSTAAVNKSKKGKAKAVAIEVTDSESEDGWS